MEIQEALNNISTMRELEPLVIAAQEDIFFWGYRYTYIPGYEGTLPIDTLALKVISVVCRQQVHVSPREEIIRKITGLWEQSDRRLKEKSIITYIACTIREIWGSITSGSYSTRDLWNDYGTN